MRTPNKLSVFAVHFRRDESGVALIEMALALPVLLVMFLGMVDASTLVATKIDLEQAAQRTTDFVLAVRPTSNNTADYVTEAANAAGVSKQNVTVTFTLECDGVKMGSFTDECADGQTTERYAFVQIFEDVPTKFDWRSFASMFSGRTVTDPGTVKVVGDSTVRFQ
ncbi:TadE/TadG family type IV pilus assembly protein [Altererythrobacter sp.]|uniref:TadE/TadG family type IV pilus assembly protein n=1 Tax=Altererythrobacter sp. TaxID=1872480 RepID=UPI003D057055